MTLPDSAKPMKLVSLSLARTITHILNPTSTKSRNTLKFIHKTRSRNSLSLFRDLALSSSSSSSAKKKSIITKTDWYSNISLKFLSNNRPAAIAVRPGSGVIITNSIRIGVLSRAVSAVGPHRSQFDHFKKTRNKPRDAGIGFRRQKRFGKNETNVSWKLSVEPFESTKFVFSQEIFRFFILIFFCSSSDRIQTIRWFSFILCVFVCVPYFRGANWFGLISRQGAIIARDERRREQSTTDDDDENEDKYGAAENIDYLVYVFDSFFQFFLFALS